MMVIRLDLVVAFILSPFVLMGMLMYDAFFIQYLWAWFAVPFGLPVITYWQFVGLLLLPSLFHRTLKQYEDGPKPHMWAREIRWLLAPWFILTIAYIIHFWIMT